MVGKQEDLGHAMDSSRFNYTGPPDQLSTGEIVAADEFLAVVRSNCTATLEIHASL